MATITRFTGAEKDTASAAGTGFFDSITGTMSRSTSSPMHGDGCWELSLSASSNSSFAWTVSGTTIVGVGYFKLISDATPAADLRLFEGRTTDGVTNRYCRLGVDTSGLIFADVYDGGSVARQTAAGAISADTWYRVEFRMTSNAGGSSNTFTIDWATAAGDAAATTQTQVSSVEGTGNSFDEFRCGPAVAGTTITHTVHIDSVVLSATSGDYPLGPSKVLGYSPDGVGTHNLDAATSAYFFQNSGSDTALTTSETTSYQQIDDSPLDADTNHLKVKTSAGGGVNFQSATESVRTDTSDPMTFTHNPAAQPQGVVVAIVHGTSSTDHVSTVTYGGDSLTEVIRRTDTATEPGAAELWFLGTSIPYDGTAQTISIDLASGTTDDIHAVCMTFTTDGGEDMEVIDSDGQSGDAANPSVTLQYSGREAISVAALYGGGAAPSSFTPNGNCTTVHDHDLGAFYSEVIRQTTPGTSDFAIGGTSSSDDVAYVACAIASVSVASSPTNTLYTEHTFANSGESTDPLAVRALIAQRNDSGTTANSITAKLRANSNESNIFSGDIGSATRVFKSAYFTTAPGGAAWTDTIFDGSTLRWGYTNDVDSTPRLEAAALEAVFASSSGTNVTVTAVPCIALADAPVPTPSIAVTSPAAIAAATDAAPTVSVTVLPAAATAVAAGLAPTPSVTVTSVSTALAVAPPPSASAGTNASITAVPAIATAAGLSPTPVVSVSSVATALADLPAPTPSVSVTAAVATALADALVPTPEIAVTSVAVALADAPVPTVAITGPVILPPPAIAYATSPTLTGSVTILPPPARAAASIPSPTFPVDAVTVEPPAAIAYATAPSLRANVEILPPASAAQAASVAPNLTGGSNAPVAAVPAVASAQVPAPTITISVTSVATALAVAPAPAIGLISNATILAPCAIAYASGVAPRVNGLIPVVCDALDLTSADIDALSLSQVSFDDLVMSSRSCDSLSMTEASSDSLTLTEAT